MKTASKNTDVKQTLARGSAKMPRKLAITVARLKRAGGCVTTPRKAKTAAIRHDQSERAENCEHAAPTEQVTDNARNGGAHEIAGEAHGKQPANGHLALIDRDEIAGESHRHGKYSARHQPRRDPHGDE